MAINANDPIIKAIISDMSKMMFKIQELEKQVAAFGMEKVAADPKAGAVDVPPEEMPGFNDLDEFKPDSFKGGPEMIAVKDVDEDIKKKSEGLFEDGIKLTEEQLAELEEVDDEDLEEEAEEDEDFYDCSNCNSIACINRSMKRCPICENLLDWSDEE